MFAKLALFFMLAFCATQSEAKTVGSPRFDINDIIKQIEELVNKIHEIISEITNDFPKLIKDLEDEIKKLIDGSNLDQIIEDIKQGIKNALGQVSEKAQKCIDAENDVITQLAEAIQAGTRSCANDAQSKIEPISNTIQNLINKANEIQSDIDSRVEECKKAGNTMQIGECLMDQIAPITEELQQIEKEVADFKQQTPQAVQNIENELATCMSNLANVLAPSRKEILRDVLKCIVA